MWRAKQVVYFIRIRKKVMLSAVDMCAACSAVSSGQCWNSRGQTKPLSASTNCVAFHSMHDGVEVHYHIEFLVACCFAPYVLRLSCV